MGEHSLKISALWLEQFVINDMWKILGKRMTQLMNQSVIYKGVCRKAPATPGLLITLYTNEEIMKVNGYLKRFRVAPRCQDYLVINHF